MISFSLACSYGLDTDQQAVDSGNCVDGAKTDAWFGADQSVKECAQRLTTTAQIFGYKPISFGFFPTFQVLQLQQSILLEFAMQETNPKKYQYKYQAEAVRYNLSQLDQQHVYQVESTQAPI
jgi:hypothetical protein